MGKRRGGEEYCKGRRESIEQKKIEEGKGIEEKEGRTEEENRSEEYSIR